jgi:hypothetical protein
MGSIWNRCMYGDSATPPYLGKTRTAIHQGHPTDRKASNGAGSAAPPPPARVPRGP